MGINYDITTPPRRASRYSTRNTTIIPVEPPPRRRIRVFPVLVGMLIILAFILFWLQIVTPWWNGVTTRWDYGVHSHVSVLSGDIGHGGVSTILAFDDRGMLTVVELVNGKAYDYSGGSFIGDNKDNRIITLSFDGKHDLLIQVIGMEGSFILYNVGTQFSWTGK